MMLRGAIALLIGVAAAQAHAITVTDDSGASVTLAKPAQASNSFPELVQQKCLTIGDDLGCRLGHLGDPGRERVGAVPVGALAQPQSGDDARAVHLHPHRAVGSADRHRQRCDLLVECHGQIALYLEA